jgi:dihydrofolate reductase
MTVRIDMMMSLDGFAAGPNISPDAPFGQDVEGFLDWVFELKTMREQQGLEGGEAGLSDDVMRESQRGLGATIMGRKMFGGGPGPWPTPAWNGWWGPNPPYHTPVYVLTHYPREPLVMEGGTTFYFVTDGIETALAQAREAAGGRHIRIGGGAEVANQYLAAGLVEELSIHLVPKLIGGGSRLLDNLGARRPQLELVRTVAGEKVTHLKYRVING